MIEYYLVNIESFGSIKLWYSSVIVKKYYGKKNHKLIGIYRRCNILS